MDEILFEVRGHLGLVTLNRPKALNALTANMCAALRQKLAEWENDPAVRAVAVVGAGGRAFCAGGDVVRVANSYKAGTEEWRAFFYSEYRMNVAISAFSKPYMSFVDGIVMGGGVGISVPGDYWVASENTLFAMPETGLGLFPDVGGGWFLPRLPGSIGIYLALTGARLKVDDLVALGLATHRVSSLKVRACLKALENAESVADVEAVLDAHREPSETAPLSPVMDLIDDCFDAHTVEDILRNLQNEHHEWCRKQADILASKSPTSLKLTLRQLQEGLKQTDFASNMAMEYRLVNRVLTQPDFFEGVRAILVDKDNTPKWSPVELSHVDDDLIESFFDRLPSGAELFDGE